MKHGILRSKAAPVAAGLWVVATMAYGAATNYVALPPAGDDANTGTGWGDAWATLSNAVAQSSAGELILVSNGTYAITAQVTVDKELTIRGFSGNPADTIVNAGGADIYCFRLSDANARVESLTITNGRSAAYLDYGGVVRNCVIVGHKASNNATGVHCDHGGLVENCIIRDCRGYYTGGGATLSYGGTLRNCLITDNVATRAPTFGGGGGALCTGSGGLVENCIITRNTAKRGGGLYASTVTTVRNSIVHGNTAPTASEYRGSVSFNNSCTFPLPTGGSGNTAADPQFVDPAADNYHLLPGSPGHDTGAYQAWMADAVDLDGDPRTNGVVDMGCYEYTPGALDCGFSASPSSGFPTTDVVLTAAVAGTNTTGVTYEWDFTNDGSYDSTGADKGVVTNPYSAHGRHTVALRVSNSVSETGVYTRANAVAIGPATNYVARTGNTPAFPYDSWATAASNVQAAVDAAVDGSAVVVGDGAYVLNQTVTISNAVTLRSAGGMDAAVFDGNNAVPCLYVDHTGAAVDGFTVTNGRSTTATAAGVHIYRGGTVRNCRIIRNVNTSTSGAGGFRIAGESGTVSHCVVTLNAAAGHASGGGAVEFGTVRNCLVVGNQASTGSGSCGGINSPSAGNIESCTVVGNSAGAGAGGIKWSYGSASIYNTIASSNFVGAVLSNWAKGSATVTAAHNGTTPSLGSDCITDDPAFVDPGTGAGTSMTVGDYHLGVASPCINVGTNRAWMAGSVDLDGVLRIVQGTADMGVYESEYYAGTVLTIK